MENMSVFECAKCGEDVHMERKANLFKRGVCDNNLCPICLQEEETVAHVSWGCPAANDVWGGSRMKL
jgi:hypothetical protein